MPREFFRQLQLPDLKIPIRQRLLHPTLPENRVKGGGITVPVTQGNFFAYADSLSLSEFGASVQQMHMIRRELKKRGEVIPLVRIKQDQESIKANADVFGYEATSKTIQKLISSFSRSLKKREMLMKKSDKLSPYQKSMEQLPLELPSSADIFVYKETALAAD